jgi:hypothetical protein
MSELTRKLKAAGMGAGSDRQYGASFGILLGGFLFPYNRNAAAEKIGMTQPWDGYPMFLPRWSAGPLSVRHPFPCEDSQKM